MQARGVSSSSQYVEGQIMQQLGDRVSRHNIGTPPETYTPALAIADVQRKPKRQRLTTKTKVPVTRRATGKANN